MFGISIEKFLQLSRHRMHLGKNNNNNYQFGWHFGIREIHFLRMHFPCLFFRTEAKNHKNEDSSFTFCFSFLLNCVGPIGPTSNDTLSLYLSLSFSIIFSIWLLIKSSSLIKKMEHYKSHPITTHLTPHERHTTVHGNPNRKSPPNESPIVITKSNPQKLEPMHKTQTTIETTYNQPTTMTCLATPRKIPPDNYAQKSSLQPNHL